MKNHYVDKNKLYEELKKYHKARKAKEDPKISEYIGECIYLICDGLARRPNFNGYTYKLDMIADGIEDCVAAVKNFNPRKSKNPFGYFSRIAWWAFVQRILIEKKQQYLKHKNYLNNFMLADIANTENEEMERLAWSSLSDQVIENFEKSLTKTKKESKIRKTMEKENANKSKKVIFDSTDSNILRGRASKRKQRSKRFSGEAESRPSP